MPKKATSAKSAEKKTAVKKAVEEAAEMPVVGQDGATESAQADVMNATAVPQAELEPETAAEQTEQTVQETQEPAKSAEEPAEPDEKNNEMAELRAQVARLTEQLNARSPQIVQVMADTEKVALRFCSECAPDNVAIFGPGGMYGQVTGQTGMLSVPKTEWSRFMTESVRFLLSSRQLIVLSGLTDDERVMYGVDYKPGELLDEMAFTKLLDMGRELLAVFPKLCRSHQEMVASRFLTASLNGDPRADDRELMKALNTLSQENGQPALFKPIIERMNERDAE